jgi:hypothetical protein
MDNNKKKENGSSFIEETLKSLALIQRQLLKDVKTNIDEGSQTEWKYKKMLIMNKKVLTKINEAIKIKKNNKNANRSNTRNRKTNS